MRNRARVRDCTLSDKISGAKKDRVVWTSIDLGEPSHVTPATMKVGDTEYYELSVKKSSRLI